MCRSIELGFDPNASRPQASCLEFGRVKKRVRIYQLEGLSTFQSFFVTASHPHKGFCVTFGDFRKLSRPWGIRPKKGRPCQNAGERENRFPDTRKRANAPSHPRLLESIARLPWLCKARVSTSRNRSFAQPQPSRAWGLVFSLRL